MLSSMLEFSGFGGYGYSNSIDPEIDAISVDTVSECAGDPFDYLLHSMYEGMLESKAIEQNMMFDEYKYLYEHGTVIEESGDSVWESIKNAFTKVKEWIIKQWHKVCEFFKKIFSFFARKTMSTKKFIEKYESKVSSKSVKLKKGIEVHKNTIAQANEIISKALNTLKKYGDDETSALSNTDNYVNGSNGRYGDTYENDAQIKKLFELLGYGKSSSISNFKEAFKKDCLGDKETKNDVVGSQMIAELKESISATTEIKKTYNNTKLVFDNLKKNAERAEKTFKQNMNISKKADQTEDKSRYEKLSKAAGVAVKVFKLAISVTEAVNHTGVSAMKKLVDEKEHLATASIFNTETEEKKTNESAFFGLY